MCYEKEIYGMTYVFHGFEGVEEYLPDLNERIVDGKKITLNPALDSWFGYFQPLLYKGTVKKVWVINICEDSAVEFVENLMKDKENKGKEAAVIYMLKEARKNKDNNGILAQQGFNFILINYDEVKKKAENMGKEVFFSILLHESTHLLEQYLAGDSGIYNSLNSEKRAGYSEALLISEKDRAVFNYLSETANYQKECDIGVEGLTSLVEALTYCQLTAANPWIVGELQQKLLSSIEIAQNDGVL